MQLGDRLRFVSESARAHPLVWFAIGILSLALVGSVGTNIFLGMSLRRAESRETSRDEKTGDTLAIVSTLLSRIETKLSDLDKEGGQRTELIEQLYQELHWVRQVLLALLKREGIVPPPPITDQEN